jgi:hypothetical protein
LEKVLPLAEPAIRPRGKCICQIKKGRTLRSRTAKEFIKDPKAWKEDKSWLRAAGGKYETTISTLKRKFGEFLRSISPLAILNEVITNCLTYDIISAYRRSSSGR